MHVFANPGHSLSPQKAQASFLITEQTKPIGRNLQVPDGDEPRDDFETADSAETRRLKTRTAEMAKALGRLRHGAPGLANAPWLTVITGNGADRVVVNGGNVKRVSTEGGDDVISIAANTVESVYSDSDPRYPAGGPDGDDAIAIAANKVKSVYSGGGDDAVAIAGGRVSSIYTGDGADAVAIAAGVAKSIYSGDGDDALSIAAGQVSGVYAGDGDDTIAISTVSFKYGDRHIDAARDRLSNDASPEDAVKEYLLALAYTGAHDIDAGAGDDTLSQSTQGAVLVAGGAGDDDMAIDADIAGLFFAAGDGSDTIALSAGTSALLRLDRSISGYEIITGEDRVTVKINGRDDVTFEGIGDAGLIAVQLGDDVEIVSGGVIASLDIKA